MHFSCQREAHLGIYGATRQLPQQMSDVAATFRFRMCDDLTTMEFQNYLVRAASLTNNYSNACVPMFNYYALKNFNNINDKWL